MDTAPWGKAPPRATMALVPRNTSRKVPMTSARYFLTWPSSASGPWAWAVRVCTNRSGKRSRVTAGCWGIVCLLGRWVGLSKNRGVFAHDIATEQSRDLHGWRPSAPPASRNSISPDNRTERDARLEGGQEGGSLTLEQD